MFCLKKRKTNENMVGWIKVMNKKEKKKEKMRKEKKNARMIALRQISKAISFISQLKKREEENQKEKEKEKQKEEDKRIGDMLSQAFVKAATTDLTNIVKFENIYPNVLSWDILTNWYQPFF
jgi:hypothetical protein